MILALYAIGDLHLSFGSDKPMDKFGGGWVNYIEKLKTGFQILKEKDVCILCGDISWGMSLEESLDDFLFIDSLPGKKIILKGNHDYWWDTVTKMNAFFQENKIASVAILHNNCYEHEGAIICGTRGWFTDEELNAAQNEKIMARETMRLRTSLQAAENIEKTDDHTKLCFFHYPPRFKNFVCRDIISTMSEFGVKKCIYGHLHGDGHRLAVCGMIEGIEYEIVSADYIDFTPKKVEYEK